MFLALLEEFLSFLTYFYHNKILKLILIAAIVLFILYKPLSGKNIESLDGLYKVSYIEKIINQNNQFLLPMVIALHGSGDNPDNFLQLFNNFTTPLRIIAIKAPPFANFKSPEDYERHMGEALAGTIKPLLDRYATKEKPFLVGFSMGAGTAYYVAANYPHLISASIPIGGKMPESYFPQEPPDSSVHIYAFHGQSDRVIPLSQGSNTAKSFLSRGYPVTFETFDGGHEIPETIREQIDYFLKENTD